MSSPNAATDLGVGGMSLTTDVGVVAKLADDGLALIAEPIKSAQIDKPINEANDRVNRYESILNETDPTKLSSDLGDFITSLFNDANIPIGEFSGRTRRVPVESLNGFILALINFIEQREKASVASAIGKQPMIPELDRDTRAALHCFLMLAGIACFAWLAISAKRKEEVDPNVRQIEIDNQFVLDRKPGEF